MIRSIIGAALVAALALPIAANAADRQQMTDNHHAERAMPNFGPRAPLQAPRQRESSDHARMADCHCAMMKMSASDCMTGTSDMHGMRSPPSDG